MRFGVAVFPGTWSDRDCAHAASLAGQDSVYLWHKETDLRGSDCVILPGGFSYGDHLRCWAIARFSPLMDAVAEFAARGGLVWGICNGFQILCEAHLLPGALMRNANLEFRCMPCHLRVEAASTPFTSACARGDLLQVPASHGEGRFVADPDVLLQLEAEERVVFRYVAPDGGPAGEQWIPNGSMRDIAGICNEARNVLGMMPHPERSAEALLGSEDGLRLFLGVARALDREGAVA
jgi:phosphoribosylformylglycinamidine synthase I